MKLVHTIIHQARRQPELPAIAFAGGVATYGALVGHTAAATEALAVLKLRPGALVALDVGNPVYHTALIYALALMGLPSVSVGAAYVAQRPGPRPDVLLTDRDLDAPDLAIRKVDQRWFAFDPAQPLPYARLLAMRGFTQAEDVVRYVFSSGTTGRAKSVALTQRVLDGRIANASIGLPSRYRGGASLNMMGFVTIAGIMAPLLTHCAGSLLCFANGNAEAMQMIRLFGVRTVAAAVVQAQGLLQVLGNESAPHELRAVIVAGSKLPRRLLTEIRARLCSNVLGGYGSTEVGGITAASTADLERDEGAAGYAYPWVELEIVDDSGKPVPAGTDGVIRVRSPELAFYTDGERNPIETTENGWFYPGDIGRLEPDGMLIVAGRTGDVINRGGVIVAPDVIEEALRLDPAVADVAVVGSPNAAGVDEIWAAIVPRDAFDPEAIGRAVQPRLAEKVPDRLFRIDAVPRNENGKVMRNVLREQLRRMLAG